jgi:hypothetical protein
MNKAQEKYINETHNIPVVYDDENYGEAQPEYVGWLERKICQCSDSDLNAVLGEVNAASLQPCETCKWNDGQISGMNIGCCNDYPCDSCRTDKWEPKD